jgi:hypothetical protein
MLLSNFPSHAVLSQGFALIAKLAPLSVLVAALTFINTIRQARAKQAEEKAQAIRQSLAKAGTAAYVLSWSLLGDREISAWILQIRESIEERLGKEPSVTEIQKLFTDRVLIESIVEKAWRDSGAVTGYRNEALDFSRIQVDIGNKIPVVQDALESISARLRMLLLSDAFIVNSIRNDRGYQNIPAELLLEQFSPMSYIQHKLLVEIKRADLEGFSEACKLVEAIAKITAIADTRKILLLLRPPSLLQRLKQRLRRNQAQRASRMFQNSVTQKLKINFPDHSTLLAQAATQILGERETIVATAEEYANFLDSITRIFRGMSGSTEFHTACGKFLAVQLKERMHKNDLMVSFVRLKCLGIEDPDVDTVLAVNGGSIDLLKAALARGADPHVGDKQVLARYELTLKEAKDAWFIRFAKDVPMGWLAPDNGD